MGITIDVDVRPLFGSARNQGARPTCVAFAVSDSHSAVKAKPFEFLSCEYLFYHAVQLTSGKDPSEGIPLLTAQTALEREGQPHENCWPYLSVCPSTSKTWKPPSKISKVWRRKMAGVRSSLRCVRDQLTRGVPVVLVMCISECFYTPDSTGLVDGENPGSDTAYHAVIAVGVGKTEGERVYLLRNSWGDGWGIEGYCWVTEKYLKGRVYDIAKMGKEL